MNLLNIIGFFIIVLVVMFTVLFIIICVFDSMMDKHLKLEDSDEWTTEEIERNVT